MPGRRRGCCLLSSRLGGGQQILAVAQGIIGDPDLA
jgi:hypothetical protein